MKSKFLTSVFLLPLLFSPLKTNLHNRIDHLRSDSGFGSTYFISYFQGIQDLRNMASERMPEDVFLYLPKKGYWVDIGYRTKQDEFDFSGKRKSNYSLGVRSNVAFVNTLSKGEDMVFKLHFHPTQGSSKNPLKISPPSAVDFESSFVEKDYLQKKNNGCEVISQVVDEETLWTYSVSGKKLSNLIDSLIVDEDFLISSFSSAIKQYKVIENQYNKKYIKDFFRKEKLPNINKDSLRNDFINKANLLGYKIRSYCLKK